VTELELLKKPKRDMSQENPFPSQIQTGPLSSTRQQPLLELAS